MTSSRKRKQPGLEALEQQPQHTSKETKNNSVEWAVGVCWFCCLFFFLWNRNHEGDQGMQVKPLVFMKAEPVSIVVVLVQGKWAVSWARYCWAVSVWIAASHIPENLWASPATVSEGPFAVEYIYIHLEIRLRHFYAKRQFFPRYGAIPRATS